MLVNRPSDVIPLSPVRLPNYSCESRFPLLDCGLVQVVAKFKISSLMLRTLCRRPSSIENVLPKPTTSDSIITTKQLAMILRPYCIVYNVKSCKPWCISTGMEFCHHISSGGSPLWLTKLKIVSRGKHLRHNTQLKKVEIMLKLHVLSRFSAGFKIDRMNGINWTKELTIT